MDRIKESNNLSTKRHRNKLLTLLVCNLDIFYFKVINLNGKIMIKIIVNCVSCRIMPWKSTEMSRLCREKMKNDPVRLEQKRQEDRER